MKKIKKIAFLKSTTNLENIKNVFYQDAIFELIENENINNIMYLYLDDELISDSYNFYKKLLECVLERHIKVFLVSKDKSLNYFKNILDQEKVYFISQFEKKDISFEKRININYVKKQIIFSTYDLLNKKVRLNDFDDSKTKLIFLKDKEVSSVAYDKFYNSINHIDKDFSDIVDFLVSIKPDDNIVILASISKTLNSNYERKLNILYQIKKEFHNVELKVFLENIWGYEKVLIEELLGKVYLK